MADVVDALVRLVAAPEAEGQVFNVGSTEEITINALAERIRARTGGLSEIRHISFTEAYNASFEDMDRRVPDLTKVAALIGYRPTRSLDSIIGDVIEHIRKEED